MWRAYLNVGSDTKFATAFEDLDTAPMPTQKAQDIAATIIKTVPEGPRRDEALRAVSILSGAVAPEQKQELEQAAAVWEALAQRRWDETALVNFLGRLGCQVEDAPYIARGLLRRIENIQLENKPYRVQIYAELLRRKLHDPECVGARGLAKELFPD